MEVTTEARRDVDVIVFHGKMIGGLEGMTRFRDIVQSELGAGRTKFVLNLLEAPWADSYGIGILVGACTSVRKRGGEMVLAGATDRVMHTLEVSRLIGVFKVFETVDAAVESLAKAREIGPHPIGPQA